MEVITLNKRKTNRLLKGIIGTTVALSGLTACSSNVQEELLSVPEETNANPQTSPTEPPPSPEEADCETWTWDEEAGVYQCAEEGSENYGHYYSGGSWFPTIAAFMAGRALGGSGINNNNNAANNPNQPNQNNASNQQPNRTDQVSNPRSGMGSGGIFGG